jgi:hypothetical protein
MGQTEPVVSGEGSGEGEISRGASVLGLEDWAWEDMMIIDESGELRVEPESERLDANMVALDI